MSKKIDDRLEKLNQIMKNSSISINEIDQEDFNKIIELCDLFPDYRKKYLIKYTLADLITISILAILKVGATSFLAMEEYAKSDITYLKSLHLLSGDNIPSHDTFRRFFELFNQDYLKNILYNKIESLFHKIYLKEKDDNTILYKHIAFDGKTFNGSGRKEGTINPRRNTYVLNVFDNTSKICIDNIPIDNKESEVSVIKQVLPNMKISNCILTADALHCNKEIAKIITKKRGEYCFTIKENQKEVLEEIKTRFNQIDNDYSSIGEVKHITQNNRIIDFIILNKLARNNSFPNVKTYVRMKSKAHNNKTYADYQYFVTSLNDYKLITQAIENRWKIEGDYHYFKDTYLKEDKYTFTNNNAIKNMATLNSVLYTLFKLGSILLQDKNPRITKYKFRLRPVETILLIYKALNGKDIIEELKKIK